VNKTTPFVDETRRFAYLKGMTVRPILKIPDSVLRRKAKPVLAVDDSVRALMDDMLQTMYDAPGIGLAAVQVGVEKRVVVADLARDDEEPEPLFLANPEIVWVSEEIAAREEGCLSIPEVFETVERPAECKVRYLDRDGKEQELHCEGLLSACMQHEVDHLNGVLFIDHISRLKRDRIVRKFAKARRQEELEQAG